MAKKPAEPKKETPTQLAGGRGKQRTTPKKTK